MLDVAGKVVGEREFEHGGAGPSEMANWLLSFAAGEAGNVGVAIETPRGPVVESLMERGFAVHSINPKQLDRFRDRLSPAGAKDDRRDARVLASALRTDPHCLRRLEPTDPVMVELQEWSRLSEELTRERVRQANRMREQLWRYYPQFLEAVDDDVASPWALDLWRKLPTPRAGQRIRLATLARVLKQHRIRRIDAATLRDRLRAPPRPPPRMCGSSSNASSWSIGNSITRAASSTGWCASLPSPLRRTTRTRPRGPSHGCRKRRPTRPSCFRCPASAPACWPRYLPRVATRCGGGTTTHCAVSAEWLRSLGRSGKSLLVTRRLAAHNRLRDAAYHWARVAAQHDPVSHAKYQALRGHGHARALRSVADRLLNVACAMLRNGTCFGRHRAGTGHRVNGATQRPRATPSLHAQVRRESKRAPKRRLQNGGESFYSIGVGSFYVVKARRG